MKNDNKNNFVWYISSVNDIKQDPGSGRINSCQSVWEIILQKANEICKSLATHVKLYMLLCMT